MTSATIRKLSILAVSGLVFVTAFPALGAIYIAPVFGLQIATFLLYGFSTLAGIVLMSRPTKTFPELLIGLYLLTIFSVFVGSLIKLFVVASWSVLLWSNFGLVLVVLGILVML